ncbi:hypothetical protein [Methylobacterium gnaphalii]|uniref:Uncharacterized protein n=1 Tax=Methylobacterium gnaphalii TaxID=1010610 RepID=A0A512JPA4_9HYPH|nr:hypothetical protein [Methylobacterium gnaphalii]GEP11693.1 hypothetical protein MGN01_35380 [Methylobacterium gnaphalii]GJD68792.1 hypothetical protein MMMDOFMJ_1716 [Methylobacterium gnaphalii]GLS50191.1 hypothetical protein GCM10007885_30430 [Methylobacterium gnaphalii]
MRSHAFKTAISVAVGTGASAPLPLLLTYRVTRGGDVEIQTARVLGEDVPNCMLRRIENDASLIGELRAKATEDVADDRLRRRELAFARAA